MVLWLCRLRIEKLVKKTSHAYYSKPASLHSSEREIIDVVAKEFIVDGLTGIVDPRGMLGVRLEVEAYLITGSRTAIHNVVRCVERAGIEVANLVLMPMAASTVALSHDERKLGVALVDIGAGATRLGI